MTLRKTHRVVVEITFDRPVTQRDAAALVGVALDRVDASAAIRRFYVHGNVPRVVKTGTKQFNRVLAAELRKGLAEEYHKGFGDACFHMKED